MSEFGIFTEAPLWLGLFCIIGAGAFAWWLYYRDDAFRDQEKWKIRTMTILRFLSLFLISFLILSPLIRSLSRFIEKPIIIFAQDDSESVLLRPDSVEYRKKLANTIREEILKPLEKDFEVRTYSFGKTIREGIDFSFKDKETNMSQLISEIRTRYVNRNVGAVILSGDGIYNRGINPLYPAGDLNAPIIALALGDTAVQKDVHISDVNFNRIAFLRSRFPIQVQVDMQHMPGAKTTLRITSEGTTVFSREVVAKGSDWTETIGVELEARKVGIQRFHVELDKVPGELNPRNNARDIVIEVIDSRKRILLLANAVHPDLAAIRLAMEPNENYKLDVATLNEFKGKYSDYQLIILHQLPSGKQAARDVLSAIFKEEIPVLFILGSQSQVAAINNLRAGLEIRQGGEKWDEAFPIGNPQFSLFESGASWTDLQEGLPPLIVPFGDYQAGDRSNVLFYQKIKSVNTDRPLLFFNQIAGHKIGFLVGEGIWRWRLQAWIRQGNHLAFDDLVGRLVQYLALSASKERFLVKGPNFFSENEPVVFGAEFYNESFQPVNEPEVKFEMRDANGKRFPFVFSRLEKGYRLNAGNFPVGDYSYMASTSAFGKEYVRNGRFSVLPLDIEARTTEANHDILNQMASNQGGEMFYLHQADSLVQFVKSNEKITPVSFTEESLLELVHLKSLFFLILFFLSAEWFFRKFWGSY